MRIDFKTGTLYCGDCFAIMADTEAGSVDMILNDPPYGTTQNKWDSVLPLPEMWAAYWRALKVDGAAVITAAQPFTSALVMSQVERFKYDWTWKKSKPTGHLNAKRMPMRNKEDVLVFSRGGEKYFPQGTKPTKVTVSRTNRGNYGSCSKTTEQTVTGYPVTIVEFNTEAGIHPTQKPVALFEYLLRTYTNPGELVLDPTAGSGTTAIAAIQSGRRWICIERDQGYFEKACERVAKAEEALI